MKKVLLGGTFDPVHNGHVVMVNLLLNVYDSVTVMPAALSPFKAATCAGDAERLEMLRLAFRDRDGVRIDSYEIDKGGVSYTVDTLKHYPECDFAVGGDAMNTLSTWKEADEIRTSVRIAVIAREGVDCAAAVEAWNADGGQAFVLGTAPKFSSSAARLRLGLQGRCDFLPEAVEAFALERRLYRNYEDIKELFARFHLKQSRIRHSYGVAITALALAETYGGAADTVIRAALIHDIAKYVTVEEARNLGVKPSSRALTSADSVRHAHLGADIAEQLLHETPEIVDAIRWHTTAKPNMSSIAMYVALADYIEPERDFEGVEEVRALAEDDLVGAFVRMLEITLEHLKSDGKIIEEETYSAYRFYSEIIKKG